MKKGLLIIAAVVVIVLIVMAALGSFKSDDSPALDASNEVRDEVENVGDLQTLIRENAMLIVEAGKAGLDVLDVAEWNEAGRAAAQKVTDGDYAEARADLEALNAEIRAEIDSL